MIVIHIIRKPLSESRLVDNVLRHGAGALNIDGCRIESAPMGRRVGISAYQRSTVVITSGEDGGRELKQARWENTKGRFPSNVILSHRPECESQGIQRVPGLGAKVSSLGKGREGNHGTGIYGAHGGKATTAYVDADGLEPVEVWDCDAGCGVADLDEQSRAARYLENLPVAASRFFKQVKS